MAAAEGSLEHLEESGESDVGEGEHESVDDTADWPSLKAAAKLPEKTLKKWVPQHHIYLGRAGYGVVKRTAARLGWKKSKQAQCSFAWMDRWGAGDVQRVDSYRLNHFPGAVDCYAYRC